MPSADLETLGAHCCDLHYTSQGEWGQVRVNGDAPWRWRWCQTSADVERQRGTVEVTWPAMGGTQEEEEGQRHEAGVSIKVCSSGHEETGLSGELLEGQDVNVDKFSVVVGVLVFSFFEIVWTRARIKPLCFSICKPYREQSLSLWLQFSSYLVHSLLFTFLEVPPSQVFWLKLLPLGLGSSSGTPHYLW